MRISEIIEFLEGVTPRYLQESYDNSGLIVGDRSSECTGVLVCLDSIESIVDEAIQKGCNLIVAHHPILFAGIKSLTGRNYVERTLIKAIRNNISIYAIHTNLDNDPVGVNRKICEVLSIEQPRILAPMSGHLTKLVVFCPKEHAEEVRQAIFNAGGGHIGNYDHCSFNSSGEGTFRAGEGTDPYVGDKGVTHSEPEVRIESIINKNASSAVLQAVLKAHPYEEVAYDLYPLNNSQQNLGAGMIGKLSKAMDKETFLKHLKTSLKTGCIRYTEFPDKLIETVAVCGGSGSFLLRDAISKGADVLVTADFKYHQFFDAENRIVICDVGHYESEQFTISLLADRLKEKFPKFAVHLTEINTNPINYY